MDLTALDPGMLKDVAQLASFVGDFFTTRKSRTDAATAEEFREWLEREAFPRLLNQSDQAMTTLLSLKANQREQFDQIMGLLKQIRELVSGASPASVWGALEDPEQRILACLYEQAITEPDPNKQYVSDEELGRASGTAGATLSQHLRHLDEEGLVKIPKVTGVRSAGARPKGLLLAWAVIAPAEHQAALARLRDALPRQPQIKSFGDYVKQAEVPGRLAYAVLETWKAEGLLQFDDNAGITSRARIHRVAEKVFRS